MFGSNAPIWRFLQGLQSFENPPVARTSKYGLHVLEVFPALALPALEPEILQRRRAARYNPIRKTFSRDDWRLVATCLCRRADTWGMAPLSRWAGRQADLAVPTKYDQDRIDAAICLIVALEWRNSPRDRVAVIGDGHRGYMVTPVSAETREVLERAAIASGVPFDADWRESERPPDRGGTRLELMSTQHVPAPIARRRPAVPTTTSPRRNATTARRGHRARIVFDPTLLRYCLVQAARAGGMLTYGEVARRFGIRWSQGASAALVSALERIAEENRRQHEPLLMSLVVSKASGMPGRGFFLTTGSGSLAESDRRARHQEHLRQVRAFDWPD